MDYLADVYKPFSILPLGEVAYVAKPETILEGLYLYKNSTYSLGHSSAWSEVCLHKDSTHTMKLSPSQLLQLRIALHMIIFYDHSGISGIYFPKQSYPKISPNYPHTELYLTPI